MHTHERTPPPSPPARLGSTLERFAFFYSIPKTKFAVRQLTHALYVALVSVASVVCSRRGASNRRIAASEQQTPPPICRPQAIR